MELLKKVGYLFRDAGKAWSEDKAPRLAAALAYYTIFSLAPLLIIAIGIAGLFLGEATVQQGILDEVANNTSPEVAASIQTMIENVSQPSRSIPATIVGFVILLFGASTVLGQLQQAFDTIWKVPPRTNEGLIDTIKHKGFALAMVLLVGVVLLLSLALSTIVGLVERVVEGVLPPIVSSIPVLDLLFSVLLLALLFAVMFKFLPRVPLTWRDVGPGAIVTAVLLSLGKYGIGLYLNNSGAASAYGAAGSLVLLLLWIYYSAQILFFGAEFSKVYAQQYGSQTSEVSKTSEVPHEALVLVERGAAAAALPPNLDPPGAEKSEPSPSYQRIGLVAGITTLIIGSGIALFRWLSKSKE